MSRLVHHQGTDFGALAWDRRHPCRPPLAGKDAGGVGPQAAARDGTPLQSNPSETALAVGFSPPEDGTGLAVKTAGQARAMGFGSPATDRGGLKPASWRDMTAAACGLTPASGYSPD